MSLTSAMNTSLSGLRAAQAGLDVVSQNIANSGTVGYTRRTLVTTDLVAGGRTIGVDVKGASRTLDTLLQRQLRLEQAGASYATTRADGQSALSQLFDRPGGVGALPTLLSNFTSRLQSLANNPASQVTQGEFLATAGDLAQSLNSLSDQVQAMRQDSENAIGSAVSKADALIQQIADINGRIPGTNTAAMQDQRDALVDQLSTLMDVKATVASTGTVSVSTNGGLSLVDGTRATRLSFAAQNIGPESTYSTDPAKRTVGTVLATDASGNTRDVAGYIRSGEIAAQIDLRDSVLPQAQAQLDELAAGLAQSLSDKPVPSTAVTAGAQAGFDLDLAGLAAGNRVTVSVTDPGGAKRNVIFAATNSAAGQARANEAGVIGLDISGGPAGIASQIQTALGANYAVSNPAASTVRILNNGSTSTVGAAGAALTVSGIATGTPELPLFVDGGTPGGVFTGSFEGGTSQLAGFAGRITVNQAVKNSPSVLGSYGPGIPEGDSTRASLLYDRLARADRSFSGTTGIAGSSSPWNGSVVGFAQAMVTTQASEANSATNLEAGQQVVLNAIQSRFSEQAGVNIDTELTQLIQLQTAYSANARLMTAAREMFDTLFRIAG